MNIRPETFAAITRDIGLLQEQVTALFALIGTHAKPRDPSIKGFCERKGISRSSYLAYRKAGIGPIEGRTNGRVFITAESEDAWDRARQAHAAEQIVARRKAKTA